MHSLFGASKVAADVLVQEYGRYFGMPTVCFRGGCLTGPHHSGAELHGFLAYLARAVARGPHVPDLRLQGQAGPRQHPLVRRLHGDRGLRRATRGPAPSTTSAAAARTASRCSRRSRASRSCSAGSSHDEYVDEPRRGDHICYISDLARFRADYPEWELTISLDEIFDELVGITAPAAPA